MRHPKTGACYIEVYACCLGSDLRVSDLQLEILISQKHTTGVAVVGSLLCSLNVTGQFLLRRMAAQLSDPELGLEIWLGCDVMAWGTPRITVHAGKIDKISDFILVRATRPCINSVPINLSNKFPAHKQPPSYGDLVEEAPDFLQPQEIL